MSPKMSHGISSSSPRWKYHVFLSFHGEDTRNNFTAHLFTALNRDGIHTFRDDEELRRGEDISSELMDAVESSRIAIVVFSENYASSTWCLKELVKILECKQKGQIERVLPVFYKVDPSVVRNQKRKFEEAFVRHTERFKDDVGKKVETWKAALTESANLSGWYDLNIANGNESELIKIIVEEVSKIVNQTCFNVAKYPVGLKSHVERICGLLNDGLDIHFLGIYGLGGIGKTTIAKAVFNVMFEKFDGSSFLANVREVSSQRNGIASLQNQLISDIVKKNFKEINNEDRGITIIQRCLRNKKVLIVLDDVDQMEQLHKLVGAHDWFGQGSRIIITTRDGDLLNMREVNKKYEVETLNQTASLQLFSFHAFGQDHPSEDFVGLSKDVVKYAGGLPLALVILGSFLLGRSQDEWESELEKLRKITNNKILKILETSYDALDEFNQTIFLDISCFFIGYFKDKVITILDACGLCAKAGIELLVKRSLLTIDGNGKLYMHDLIRDMGREIVRRQSPRKPGERSRLWNHDAVDVLRNSTGTDAVEGLVVNFYQCSKQEFHLMTTNTLSKMPHLRLLNICGPSWGTEVKWEHCHDEDSNLLLKDLVWQRWECFPFECIPNNFDMRNLVILDLQHSTKLKELWTGTKHLPKLKVLNLSSSHSLTRTPDFSGLLNLEKMFLNYCSQLLEVEGIGQLSKLVELDLSWCKSLRNLPSSIGKLASLEKLYISDCKELELEALPDDFWNLFPLKSLDLSDNGSLKSLPMLPSSLRYLYMRNCKSLERLPNLSNLKHLRELDISNCQELTEIEGFEGLESVEAITSFGCDNIKNFVIERMIQVICKDLGNPNICDIYLSATRFVSWADHVREIFSGTCEVVQVPNMDIQGVILSIVCSCQKFFFSYASGRST